MNDKLAQLNTLAYDLNWTWNRDMDKIWEHLDREIWERCHNPCALLQTISQKKLESVLNDPHFCKILSEVLKGRQEEEKSAVWFQLNHAKAPLSSIAYFSMEFMLNEALPIYSGGLGNVAGDQLKAASDLGVPVIGVGLLYQQGYFRQMINKEGNQQALYPFNDPDQLPIKPLRDAEGEWVRIEIGFPGWTVWLRAWEAKIGRVKLYLLDSNDPVNYPVNRGLTSELYGGDSELRLKQEIILGIGGWKLLKKMGHHPEVCHLNEGHAAFAVLERACDFMKANQLPFKEALYATRVGNLFTTHTAVPAGFDRFSPALMQQYMERYAEIIQIPFTELMALGRANPDDSQEFFNMAYLAIRGSGAINGVSQLHGKVSRSLFQPLFPHFPEAEVPVGSVTNGVHMPSWESEAANRLWTEICGKFRWQESSEEHEKDICKASNARLWQMRNEARDRLIDYTREKLASQIKVRGYTPEELTAAATLFDPKILTLGFARRFATYKRPNLLLHDRQRLKRLLTHPTQPIQLIIAGKAHPADQAGQAMIKEWIQFMQENQISNHLIFLSDYDMQVTEELVRGVDVWINTPRRPWEACGTSGMKVLVNGGLNLSELDGWWVEAYSPKVGWAIGDGKEHGADPAWDAYEANQLYDLLEKEIIPAFYTKDREGIPTQWIDRVRASLATLTPRFSATRSVTEYTEKYYLPAAITYQMRAQNKGAFAQKIIQWKKNLDQNWGKIGFGKITTQGNRFEIEIDLKDLDPRCIKVELYAEGTPPEIYEMKKEKTSYQATTSGKRPTADYTVRLRPYLEGAILPLEENRILWQH